MRFILLLFLVLTSSAFAQKSVSGVDWNSLGRPIDEDLTAMEGRYVYSNSDTMNKNTTTEKAILTNEQAAAWINNNLAQILTLDGKQYDAQVYKNRFIFTPQGYADYILYLKSTNLGTFLKSNQYKIVAFIDGEPNVTNQQIIILENKNTFSWQITTNLALSYLDYRNQPPAAMAKANADNRTTIQAKIELVRIPAQNNNNLVAINHLTFGPVPAATESLDPAPHDE